MAEDHRILIVDGSSLLQSLVHAWLNDFKCPHQQVADAQHALSACNSTKFTLVFIDLDTIWDGPVPNGQALAQNIRTQSLNMVTPLIAMTGSSSPDPSWATYGFSDMIFKPLNKDAFIQLLQQWSNQNTQSGLDLDLSAVPMVDMTDFNFPEFQDLELPIRRSARVLVVEDCTLTQHVIATLLKELTPDITQVYDGEQAILKCNTEHFDIIYMDIHMPGMGGVQATQHIRTMNTPNTYTPIIAFTSSGSLDDYTEYGMNDILQKPFTVEALKQQFDRWTPFGQSLDLNDPFASIHTGGPTNPMALGTQVPPHQPSSPLAAVHNVEPSIFSGHEDGAGSHQSSRPGSAGGSRSRSGSDPSIMVSRMPVSGPQSPLISSKPASTGRSSTRGASKWNKKKSKNSLGHTEKEKQRRADIVSSCNNFRLLIPVHKDADKATIFRTAVDYTAFLRSRFTSEQLQQVDSEFIEQTNMRQLESDSARLNIDSPIDSPSDSRHSSRPESPLSAREQSPVRTASSPMLTSRGRSPNLTRTHSGPSFGLRSPLAQNGSPL
eukprot:m.73276 g.73276  ORF g.73276 m.73276 type:complete len:549 (+) comp14321_c0_seq2:140-1786(+)